MTCTFGKNTGQGGTIAPGNFDNTLEVTVTPTSAAVPSATVVYTVASVGDSAPGNEDKTFQEVVPVAPATNPVPAITSLSPPSAIVGGAAFTLGVNGTGFVSGATATFGGVSRTVTFVSATLVNIAVLATDIAATGTPAVVVTNPAPGGGASNSVAFDVNNPVPVITAPLVPSSVLVGSGALTLTVNGTGFINGATATYGGSSRSVTFVSSTQLTIAVLAGDTATAGTFPVVVTNPGPGGGASNSVNFSVNNPVPAIIAPLVPSGVIANSGAFTLTVNGTGFISSSQVSFGGTNRVTTFVSSTQVTAAILATDVATAGSPLVVVTNPAPGGGASNSVVFNVSAAPNPVPVITSFSPPSATTGGPAFTLMVTGSSFVNGATATFGGASRTVTFVSATQVNIAVLAADIATAGTPAVVVTNPAPGGGPSNSLNFAVNNPVPAITSLAPPSAIVGGAGFSLTVNGSGFVSGATGTFNGNSRTVTFVNSGQVTIAVLAGDIAATGTFPVVITNPAPGGGASNSVNFTVNNPVPAIVAPLVPASVLAGSGALSLTVNGTGFVSGATATYGGSSRSVTFVNSTQLTIAVLAGDTATAGTFPVVVTNPGPGGGASNSVNFAVNNPVPVIIPPLSPASALAGSGAFTLTVNGTGFVNGATVSFGGAARTTTFVSSTQVTAAILAADVSSAGTPAVIVTNPAPGGGASNSVTFAVNNPMPAITTLSPTSVSAGSGAFTLTVNGSGFINTSVVQWNGSNRTTTFVNTGQVTAAITAADVLTVSIIPVTVVNAAPGGGTSNVVDFTVTTPVPVLTSLVPNSAVAGGAAFTLTTNGSNFINTSEVMWNGSERTTTFVNAGQLTAAITAADILTAGTATVTIFTPTVVPAVVIGGLRPMGAPLGTTSNPLTFTINAPNPVPTLISLAPASGTAGSAAFTLTINGTNFISTSVANWNGSARTTTFVNSGQVTAAITAADIAATGTPSVTVVNPAPGGGTSNALTFTITDFSVVNATAAQTVTAGQAAMYTINVSGVGGTFPGSVTFSASGLPPLTTAGFVPQSVSPGAGTVPSTLTLTTTARGIAGHILPGAPGDAPNPKLPQPMLWLGMMGLLGATLLLLKRTRKLSPRVAAAGFLALAAVCVVGFASGCNGGGFPAVQSGTPAGTYMVTVTGTSGGVAHSTMVSLTVQ